MPVFKNQIVKIPDPTTHLPAKAKLISRKGDYWQAEFPLESGTIITVADDNVSKWTEDDDRLATAHTETEIAYQAELALRPLWSVFLLRIQDTRSVEPPHNYVGRPGATGTLKEQWHSLPIIPDFCLVLACNAEEAMEVAKRDLFLDTTETITVAHEFQDKGWAMEKEGCDPFARNPHTYVPHPLKAAILEYTDKKREFDKQTQRGWLPYLPVRAVAFDH